MPFSDQARHVLVDEAEGVSCPRRPIAIHEAPVHAQDPERDGPVSSHARRRVASQQFVAQRGGGGAEHPVAPVRHIRLLA